MFSYLYIIENKLNGKIYIGKTCTPKQRWINHKSIANVGPSNPNFHYVHKSMRKHLSNIEEVFTFTVFEECINDKDAYASEKIWIEYLKSINFTLYNLSEGGEGFLSGPDNKNYGIPRSDEVKRKISEKNKGRPRTKKWIENLKIGQKDKHHGELAGNSFLKENQVIEIRNQFNQFKKIISRKNKLFMKDFIKDMSIKYKVSIGCIRDITENKTWTRINVK